MCQKCVDLMKKYYPHLSESEWGDLLIGATCWPMGDPDMVEEQLIELKLKTDGTLLGALAYADKKLRLEYERSKELENVKS